MVKPKSRLFYSYAFFLIIYIAFTLFPSPSKTTLLQYHVSVLGLRLIDVSIILLSAAIWFAGFYGYSKLQDYRQLIKNDKDGRLLGELMKGILLLVLWLPITEVISSVLGFFAARHVTMLPAVTIINNYIGLLFPLAGFVLVGRAARDFGKQTRFRISYRTINLLAIFLVYIGVIYYHLVVSTFDRATVYHLSLWTILLTIVAPYIYMWFIGLMSVYDLYGYSKNLKGVLYKKSWGYLAFGLGWLIVLSIGLQYLTSLSARLANLSIYWVLAIIYTVLLVLSVGFILIALGARKLQKIEEV